MRKQIILLLAALMSMGAMAQGTPTKFLGIPIDGTKQAMIQKLQAQGFTYNQQGDYLIGDFNGYKSEIVIRTNRNKVWRIMVLNKTGCSEDQIRIRYNTLLDQFLFNAKYRLGGSARYIPEDENIAYKLAANEAEYEVGFLQKAPDGEFYKNNEVWFTIYKDVDGYFIVIYYDNLNNGANGEDL